VVVTNTSLAIPRNALAHLGGHASRKELVALGCDPDYIDLSLWYRNILPTRRGWYASAGTDPLVLRALRVGGRLACVSALAWHEGIDVPRDEPVHVLVKYGASRLGSGAVLHWTRRYVPGGRLAVTYAVAKLQAERCKARRPC
jgi:hypothetical protein